MDNLYDYLYWRGDLSFKSVPPNEIDFVIFAVLSYIDFSSVLAPEDFSVRYSLEKVALSMAEKGSLVPKPETPSFEVECLELLPLLATKTRFRDITLLGYSCNTEKDNALQFAAISFLLPSPELVVSFRGTDATLIGWKEDFMMSFKKSVGSQECGLGYLERVAQVTSAPLSIVGHSKGGNVASYSALKASKAVQHRINRVYSFDGPGFNEQSLKSLENPEMKEHLTTLVPQGSVVGILMQHEEPIEIVYSCKKGGISQHMPFTWEVHVDHFKRLEERDRASLMFDKSIRKWLEGLDEEEINSFINSFFSTAADAGVQSVSDLKLKPGKTLSNLIKVYSKKDLKTRKQIEKTIGALLLSMREITSIEYKSKRDSLIEQFRNTRKETMNALFPFFEEKNTQRKRVTVPESKEDKNNK